MPLPYYGIEPGTLPGNVGYGGQPYNAYTNPLSQFYSGPAFQGGPTVQINPNEFPQASFPPYSGGSFDPVSGQVAPNLYGPPTPSYNPTGQFINPGSVVPQGGTAFQGGPTPDYGPGATLSDLGNTGSTAFQGGPTQDYSGPNDLSQFGSENQFVAGPETLSGVTQNQGVNTALGIGGFLPYLGPGINIGSAIYKMFNQNPGGYVGQTGPDQNPSAPQGTPQQPSNDTQVTPNEQRIINQQISPGVYGSGTLGGITYSGSGAGPVLQGQFEPGGGDTVSPGLAFSLMGGGGGGKLDPEDPGAEIKSAQANARFAALTPAQQQRRFINFTRSVGGGSAAPGSAPNYAPIPPADQGIVGGTGLSNAYMSGGHAPINLAHFLTGHFGR